MSSIKVIVTLAMITILSVGAIGCSNSDVTTPAAIDTAPPAVPSNLNAAYNDGVVTVSWDVNTVDSDLAGYIVRRDNYGQVTTLVASPTLIQNFNDTPQMGTNTYQVYSVDLVGNESAIASVSYQLTGSHQVDGVDFQF